MKQVPYQAPDFQLSDSDGQVRRLEDYAGRWLVLYFYPKDDTPGCTTEACGMRDARDDLTDLNAEIVGISSDDASSHEAFKAKHNLNFTLLSDPEKEVMQTYGAWDGGPLRKTFIIDPEGEVVKAYDDVTPGGHGEQVVEDLKNLQQAK